MEEILKNKLSDVEVTFAIKRMFIRILKVNSNSSCISLVFLARNPVLSAGSENVYVE